MLFACWLLGVLFCYVTATRLWCRLRCSNSLSQRNTTTPLHRQHDKPLDRVTWQLSMLVSSLTFALYLCEIFSFVLRLRPLRGQTLRRRTVMNVSCRICSPSDHDYLFLAFECRLIIPALTAAPFRALPAVPLELSRRRFSHLQALRLIFPETLHFRGSMLAVTPEKTDFREKSLSAPRRTNPKPQQAYYDHCSGGKQPLVFQGCPSQGGRSV